jgi:signal peptidase I
MLPTMAADGSDVWLCSTYVWRKRFGFLPSYQRGDLVGFSHPHHPDVISCKRIVGVAGDRVQRYGQYVHLYTDQDPVNLGLTWPTDAAHAWIDPNCPWDDTGKQLDLPNNINKQLEAKRTIVVPDGHVWVEADCPALGIDSRQFGPIPVEWLQGKIVAQLWPFWRTTNRASVWDKRPHPIPLDTETLMEHNVYRLEVNQG